jgi:hypothetical protein
MNGTQVGVFEKTHQVCFGGFLQGKNGRPLESEIGLEILSNLTDKTLEWQLANEKVSGLLVTTNLTEGDCDRKKLMFGE